MQADMKSLESAVTSSLTSLSSDLSSLNRETSKVSTLSSSQPAASARPLLGSSYSRVSTSVGRSMNIVLFGVPEQTLFDTRKTIDEVLTFICGTSVPIRDLIRIGKFVEGRTRSVLVKLMNFWDKRITSASRTKLKTFRISRVFVWPDLSPEERATRRAKFSANRGQDSSTSTSTPVFNAPGIPPEHATGSGSYMSVSVHGCSQA